MRRRWSRRCARRWSCCRCPRSPVDREGARVGDRSVEGQARVTRVPVTATVTVPSFCIPDETVRLGNVDPSHRSVVPAAPPGGVGPAIAAVAPTVRLLSLETVSSPTEYGGVGERHVGVPQGGRRRRRCRSEPPCSSRPAVSQSLARAATGPAVRATQRRLGRGIPAHERGGGPRRSWFRPPR